LDSPLSSIFSVEINIAAQNEVKWLWSGVRSVKIASALRIKLYPNPASDFLSLDTEGGLKQNTRTVFRVFDILGRFQFEKELGFTQTNRISIKHLSYGIYHCAVFQNGLLTLKGRFFKF
jgi:hypothetical protein